MNMAMHDGTDMDITPQVLLKAYSCGVFPMAESADDPALYWIEPQARGILPLDHVHVAKRLARTIRQDIFEVRINSDFDGVIAGCASAKPGRDTTWINSRIRSLYRELFDQGHCHCVETWRDGRMVGGLYGVSLGGAFFGESMFSTETDASKVALVHLAARLIHGGYSLLDCQFVTDHLKQFGTIEIEQSVFQQRLAIAMKQQGEFLRLEDNLSGARTLAIIADAYRN
jgi:leucyl/phenylalanyl-tRNA---protein transferase